MNIRNRNAASRLRAAGLLTLILSGWLAAPVKLVLPEAAACEMACCLARGSHHCQMGQASFSRREDGHHHLRDGAGDEVSDGEQAAQRSEISVSAVSAPCSSQCGLPPSGLQNIPVPKTGIPHCSIALDAAQSIYARAPHFARDALVEDSHAPRAPPTTLL